MARIATHFTSDPKQTTQSLAACDYARPKPRWNMTNDRSLVTCQRCLRIIERWT